MQTGCSKMHRCKARVVSDTCLQAIIGATPVLIEAKARVNVRMVHHGHGTPGSLEHKVFRAVRDLYSGATTVIVEALAAWDRCTPPEILFVAGVYSDGAFAELKQLLARLGDAWHFGARVYRWDGTQGVCLYTQAAPKTVAPAEVLFPELKSEPAAKRTPKLTLQTLRDLLTEHGLDECLDAMLGEMDRRDVTIRARNVSNVNYGKTTLDGTKQVTLIGIWPYASTNSNGLLVSVDLAAFPQCFAVPAVADADVPGAPAPIMGYLNHQRFLRSQQEVVAFWAALVPPRHAAGVDSPT